MRLVLTVIEGDAPERLAELRAALANRLGLNQAAAARMLIPVQGTLRQMSLTNHNKFGARSTFWNLMMSGTYATATDAEAIVGMPAPVALRYFGGTVEPVQAHMLAIPNRVEAYGRSPRDFPDLDCVPFRGKDGTPILALVQRMSQMIRLLKRGVKRGPVVGFSSVQDAQERATEDDVFFWLVPMATIQGNKEVLPDDSVILAAAQAGVRSYLGRLARGLSMEAQ